jgi:hypothetical protein
MSEDWKLKFEGSWKRIKEENFKSFVQFMGVNFIMATLVVAKGCTFIVEYPNPSNVDSSIIFESIGVPQSHALNLKWVMTKSANLNPWGGKFMIQYIGITMQKL